MKRFLRRGPRVAGHLAILVALAWLPWLGCGDDNGAENPQLGTVSGTVTFVGDWPSTGNIQVSMWTSWPPAGPPAAASAVLTPGVSPQSYTIGDLSQGAYLAITVGWRDPLNPAGAKLLGIYWADADSVGVDGSGNPTVLALPVEISAGALVHSNIDIAADLDIAP